MTRTWSRRRIRVISRMAGVLMCCVLVSGLGRAAVDDGDAVQALAQADDGRPVLHLTLLDAVETALQNNTDVLTERYNVMIAESDVAVALADFDPFLKADSTFSHVERPAGSQLLGANVQETETLQWNGSVGARVVTGGSLQIAFENKREETNSSFTSLSPQYTSSMTLSGTQPLLRNAGWRVNRVRVRTAKNQRETSQLFLERTVLKTMDDVEDAYWQLVSARDNVRVQQMSLDLAKELLALTQAQVRTGLQAPIATLQAESTVASREESLIITTNSVTTAENNIKLVMNFPPQSPIWDVTIIPHDAPADITADVSSVVDPADALTEALNQNIDLKQLALNRTSQKYSIRQAKSLLLPQLDLTGSVGYSGLAGDPTPGRDTIANTGRVIPDPAGSAVGILETRVIPPAPNPFDGGYGDAVGDVFDAKYLTWSAGAQFQIPLGNRAARHEYRKAILNLKKLDLSDAQTRNTVNLLMRNLLGDLDSGRRRVEATKVAERLSKKNLETEQKKYELGLTTETDVLKAQEDYASTVTRATQALIDYNITRGKIARARAGYLPVAPSTSVAGVSSTATTGATTTTTSPLDASSATTGASTGSDLEEYGL